MRSKITSLLAVAFSLGFAQAASAADMPVKAPIVRAPVATVYDWSGFYLGAHTGYEWARVHEVQTNPGPFTEDSKLNNWVWGVHGGLQKQFGSNPWGAWLLGVEAAWTVPTGNNDSGNLAPCFNAAFSCGLNKINNLWTVGGRAGIAADTWLFAVSGGFAQGTFDRVDFRLPSGPLCAGGACISNVHNGWYVGGSVEHVLYQGSIADVIGGLEYQHVRLNNHDDLEQPGAVVHTMNADVDTVRLRLTVKTKGLGIF